MKFSEFKTTTHPTADVCDPCTLSTRSNNILYLNPKHEGFSDEDEVMLVKLRLGACPICYHRISQEINSKQVGVTWYSCNENPNHLWEVDYVAKVITPFEDFSTKESENGK